jgi:UDP-N-acetylmuramoyl-L-alanyl-D-glutamate--2,6-diaminopimelate ligase
MLLKELLQNLPNATTKGDTGIDIQKIEYDSRRVGRGDLFVSIKGYSTDGHLFIDDAIARGAAAVVLEEDRLLQERVTTIRVPNSRQALALLAGRYYDEPWRKLRVIGVTGTNGKTTTTFMIRSIFLTAGVPTGLIGTVGYTVGQEHRPALNTTPESLDLQRLFRDMVDAGERAVVMEVSSHALSLGRTYGIEFEIGVFTNLSRDHLDFHRTFDDYLAAKLLLFKELKASRGAKGVVNLDDPVAPAVIRSTSAPVMTFGLTADTALVRAVSVRMEPRRTLFRVETPVGSVDLQIPCIGRFNVVNALGAIAAGIAGRCDLDTIRQGLADLPQVPGRLEAIDCGQPFGVFVDYAHTPGALETVLLTVREVTPGRLLSVFGCGGDRDRGKRPEMGRISEQVADFSFVTSDNPRTEDPLEIIGEITRGMSRRDRYSVLPDRREAIAAALSCARAGDTVVIAGKGHEDYQIIQGEKLHFDDREVVREILSPVNRQSSIGRPNDQ